MNRAQLNFINIGDKKIHLMLEKDLEIEMYDEEKDAREDFGIGRTMSTCTARLSEINGAKFLHICSKNPLLYGEEDRIYSYDMIKKGVCKVSKIKKNISEQTYNIIVRTYYPSKICINDIQHYNDGTHDDIIRVDPIYKQIKSYPKRYGVNDFNKIKKWKEMKNVADYINYKKWKNGINPDTNRKIKIGGGVHNKFCTRFNIFIKFDDDDNKILKKIDQNEYEKTTSNIFSEIDRENMKINEYNAKIKIVIDRISRIKDWYDYVEFDGTKYGMYTIVDENYVHVEKNCGGQIVLVRKNMEIISEYGYRYHGHVYYKCEKCNYEYNKPINYD